MHRKAKNKVKLNNDAIDKQDAIMNTTPHFTYSSESSQSSQSSHPPRSLRAFSIRDKIDEQVQNLVLSCLRIGSIQDNLFSYFKDRARAYHNPTVVESSYQLMELERSRVRSILYQLLIMLNMPEEALLLNNHWSKTPPPPSQ